MTKAQKLAMRARELACIQHARSIRLDGRTKQAREHMYLQSMLRECATELDPKVDERFRKKWGFGPVVEIADAIERGKR